MKIAKALKLKNQLAGEVAQLKELLTKQNSRSTKQKFDYDNREVLTRLRAKLTELIKVKAAVAAANAEIYDQIFRLAELKGLVTALTGLDTKAGVFHEGGRFGDAGYEVEYVAQIGKVDVDKLVAELNAEIQSLQDALDEFNFTRSVNL
jgi:predicted Rossmann fold nucleotide-binding protein DprA/Smf involved in DNA uptake